MNNLMFTPDANSKPFEKAPESKVASRQAPKAINHSNTRLPDETSARPSEAGSTAGSSRRGSSPARSWVAAAVAGTPCEFEVEYAGGCAD
jgi:protein DGCR14